MFYEKCPHCNGSLSFKAKPPQMKHNVSHEGQKEVISTRYVTCQDCCARGTFDSHLKMPTPPDPEALNFQYDFEFPCSE